MIDEDKPEPQCNFMPVDEPVPAVRQHGPAGRATAGCVRVTKVDAAPPIA